MADCDASWRNRHDERMEEEEGAGAKNLWKISPFEVGKKHQRLETDGLRKESLFTRAEQEKALI